MRVIISAGGTGGHIYPALAVAKVIKEKDKDAEILYIGTSNRMEKDIVPKENIKFIGIKSQGLKRKLTLDNIKSGYLFLRAIGKCKKIIKDFKPDAVITFGGYVTAPVVYAAHKLKVKCFIHEQNSMLGVTNKFASKFADKIFISFESLRGSIEDKNKVVFTGNPCSYQAKMAPSCDKKEFNLDPSKKLVLIVMGSLGSKTINEKMKKLLELYNNKDYEVMFVTGKNYYDSYKDNNYSKNIKIVPYIDNMVRLLKKTDVLISRAGASTLSEISAVKVPSILIPSPYVTENHQYKNAMDLVNHDAALIIEEKNLEGDLLLRYTEKLLYDRMLTNKIKRNLSDFYVDNSSLKIYDEIKKIVGDKNE